MAEFDPIPASDAAEAAYAQALLGEDAGREQRRARLMAALPRPGAVVAVPVARSALARRWQPCALGLLATGLLLAVVLVLNGRNAEPPQEADPRLAVGQAASTAIVVAQADPQVEPRAAPAVEAPRVAAKARTNPPRVERSAPVVVADAATPRPQREAEMSGPAVAERVAPAMAPPPAAPAVAAAPPRAVADAAAPQAANSSEVLARSEGRLSSALARARAAPQTAQSLAASDAADAADSAKAVSPTNAVLRAAVNHVDLATARSAIQAGASVHLRDAQGRTVLMLAARTGSREMADLLLAAGARKADRDPQGRTAADHAQAQGHGELVEALR